MSDGAGQHHLVVKTVGQTRTGLGYQINIQKLQVGKGAVASFKVR
jgi:hypothetical protein